MIDGHSAAVAVIDDLPDTTGAGPGVINERVKLMNLTRSRCAPGGLLLVSCHVEPVTPGFAAGAAGYEMPFLDVSWMGFGGGGGNARVDVSRCARFTIPNLEGGELTVHAGTRGTKGKPGGWRFEASITRVEAEGGLPALFSSDPILFAGAGTSAKIEIPDYARSVFFESDTPASMPAAIAKFYSWDSLLLYAQDSPLANSSAINGGACQVDVTVGAAMRVTPVWELYLC